MDRIGVEDLGGTISTSSLRLTLASVLDQLAVDGVEGWTRDAEESLTGWLGTCR
jgi:hypothetical protein